MKQLRNRQELKTGLRVRAGVVWGSAAVATLVAAFALFTQRYQQPATLPLWSGGVEGYSSLLANLKQTDKLGLLVFTTDYCYPCQELERKLNSLQTNGDPLWSYTGLRVNAFQNAEGYELARKFEVKTFPCVVVTDSDGNELERFNLLSQWEKLPATLEKLAALRITPKQTSTPARLPRPVPPLQTEAGETAPAGTVLGIRMKETATYSDARKLARIKHLEWSREVWIHPNANGHFDLLIGAFQSKKEARITLQMLTTLDNLSGKVVRMPKDPVGYPLDPVAISVQHLTKVIRP